MPAVLPQEIPVIIGNRTTRLIATPEQLTRLKPYFAYRVPGCEFMFKFQAGMWDGMVSMLRQSRIPTGVFLTRWRAVHDDKQFHFTTQEDTRIRPKFQRLNEYDHHLWDLAQGSYAFQGRCVATMAKFSRTGGIILSATGTGKTNVAGLFFACLLGRGLFVVDELNLLGQAHKGIGAVLQKEKIGWIGEGVSYTERITVATAQSLLRLLDSKLTNSGWLHDIDVIIIDELHVMVNDRMEKIVRALNPKAVFGLTATLELDKPHISYPAIALTGPPIFRFPLKQAVEEGVLAPSVVVLLKFHNPRKPYGNTKQVYEDQIIGNEKRNNCVEALVRAGLDAGLKTVVLVKRRAHLKALSKRFTGGLMHVTHAALCGLNPRQERAAAIQAIEDGRLDLIIASEIFAKGVNITNVSLIVDVTGSPSKNAAQQRHGRGTRKNENKLGLVHIDIQDSGSHNFASAAALRAQALKALGVPILKLDWETVGDAQAVLQAAIRKLKEKL